VLEIAERFRPPAPAPRPKPLGFLGLLKALRDNPLEAWTEAHFEQPIVTTRLMTRSVAVVSDPAAIRAVLMNNAGNYCKDPLQRRMLAPLKDGVLTAEDDQWRFQRRTLAPVFSRKAVRAFAPAMLDVANILVRRWRDHGCDDIIDVAAEVTHSTLEVLERTIFADGLGRDATEIRHAMRTFFDATGRIDPFDIIGLPDFVPRVYRRQTRAALRLFESAVDSIIVTRRRRLVESPDTMPNDILTLLLAAQDPETGRRLTEKEVRANIITFISAGHETTANAISWALFLLSQSNKWRSRIAAEALPALDGRADSVVERLVETRAVIDEAIRLYPPLAAISRVAIGPDSLGQTRVEPGTIIVIAPYILHRHRRLWDEPDYFEPGRFLPGCREKVDRFAYLPFGVGPRGCIGSSFALQEAALMVATIVRHLEFEVSPGEIVWPLHRISLRPRGGLPMRVRARNARPAPMRMANEVSESRF
jgi:cytochrome P450